MDVKELTVGCLEVTGNRSQQCIVSLFGVSGDDFVACADEGLIAAILNAIGEDAVCEHFGLKEDA